MYKKIINPWLEVEGYNCFACCPTNSIGLHLDLFEDGEDIVTRWQPNDNFQSYVNTLHGGIQSLLMDELAGWVISRKLQTIGVTSKMEVKYIKPVSTKNKVITVKARLNKMMRHVAFIDAEIYDETDTLCTQGQLVYFCKTKEQAATEGFPGCEVEE